MGDYQFQKTERIPYQAVEKWSAEIYQKAGMNPEDAQKTAHIQTMADLRGVYSHGVQRCKTYVQRLERGAVNAKARPEIEKDGQAFVLVNGNNAMGQIVAEYAMKTAIERARQFGSATVSIRGSNHIGTMAYYAMLAAEQDMIGICMTQGAGNAMAPFGGTEKILGNNPFGYAVPALRHPPVVLDMAQSVVAFGKIDMAKTTGSRIPDTWALDIGGNPVTDPKKAFSLQPICGYKGYGLSFMMTLLCAVLPGVPYGPALVDLLSDSSEPQNGGQLMQVINIGALMDVNAFKKRVDEAVELVKQSRKRKGVSEIFVPGEIEYNTEQRQRAEGIVYPIELFDELDRLSEKMNVRPLRKREETGENEQKSGDL